MAGNFSPIDLRNAALALENDGEFYRKYTGFSTRVTDKARRIEIENAMLRMRVRNSDNDNSTPADREQLRRYLDSTWSVAPYELDDTASSKDIRNRATIEFWRDSVCYPDNPRPADLATPSTSDTKDTDTMNPTTADNMTISTTAAIDVKTQVLVNGKPIANYSDADLFNAIAAQEAEIERLEAIKTKPKALVAEIERRRDGLKALVEAIDARTAK